MKVREKSGTVFEVLDEGGTYYVGRIVPHRQPWAVLKADCVPFTDEHWEDVTAECEAEYTTGSIIGQRTIQLLSHHDRHLGSMADGYRLVKFRCIEGTWAVHEAKWAFRVEKRVP